MNVDQLEQKLDAKLGLVLAKHGDTGDISKKIAAQKNIQIFNKIASIVFYMCVFLFVCILVSTKG